jgi:hypothetical protein
MLKWPPHIELPAVGIRNLEAGLRYKLGEAGLKEIAKTSKLRITKIEFAIEGEKVGEQIKVEIKL